LRLPISNPGIIEKFTSFRLGDIRISNFEMETSVIYGLGALLGHHCLSLNAIIANRVIKEFSKDTNVVVERLIERSLGIISKI
jgi:uridine phosphorylase